VKVKVKLFLCLNNYIPRHEDVKGTGGIAPPFPTSAIDGGKLSISRPGRFYPPQIRGWMGPRADLDAVKKRKISSLCRESNPGHSAYSPSLYLLNCPGSSIYEG
jgi:hypothetical protein